MLGNFGKVGNVGICQEMLGLLYREMTVNATKCWNVENVRNFRNVGNVGIVIGNLGMLGNVVGSFCLAMNKIGLS